MDCSDCGVRSYREPPPLPVHSNRPRRVADSRLARRRAVWRRFVAPTSVMEVCLCTLMTADRVPSLHRLASSWTSLLSVAYLADDFEADAAAGFKLLELDGRSVPHKEQLTLSVVEDRGYRAPRSRFPFNLLRNIAVDAAPTDFVCLVDVDFVLYPHVSPNCRGCQASTRLKKWLPLLRLTPHLALVLPAFDGNAAAASLGGSSSETGHRSKERLETISTKRGIARLFRNGNAEGLCAPDNCPTDTCPPAARTCMQQAARARRFNAPVRSPVSLALSSPRAARTRSIRSDTRATTQRAG